MKAIVTISLLVSVCAAAMFFPVHPAAAQVKTCDQLYEEETRASAGGGAANASSAQDAGQAAGVSGKKAYEYGPMKLQYKNNKIKSDVTLKRKEVNEILKQMGVPEKGAGSIRTDLDRIAWALDRKQSIEDFEGTSGLMYYLFLNAASEHMIDRRGDLRSHLSIRPHGRLVENGLVVNADWSGFVQVTMCFEIAQNPGLGQPLLAYFRFSVRTDVSRCGFELIEKTREDGKPVFHGSIVDLSDVKDLDQYEYKLQAVGGSVGEDLGDCVPGFGNLYMRIGQILLDEGDGNNYRTLSPTGPDGHFYTLELSDRPCIDMLTEEDPRNGVAPEHKQPPYCLGRCTNPVMVNSGL